MEKKINKSNKKSLITLCLILVVLLAAAGTTVGTLISRNMSTSQNVEVSGEVQVEDEATLRKVLLSKGDCTVIVAKDIVVTKELVVNGTKELRGESIIMDMRHIGTAESVCAVTQGSKLVLNGATIDGNGVVNGISVKSGANLECLSGNIVFGYPYGIDVSGYVEIKDVTIDESMHTGINVAILGQVYLKGGVISNCVYGVAVAEEGYMEIDDSATIKNAYASFIINYGEMKVAGGEFVGAGDNAIENYNKLTIKGTEKDKVVISNGKKSAINSKSKAKTVAENLQILDMGWHGITVEKNSSAELENISIENTGKSSIYVNSSKVEMSDITIIGGKAYAVSANKSSKIDMKNITVKDTENRGIVNDSSTVTAENVVVEGTAKHAFYALGETAVTSITNATIKKPGVSGVAVAGGKATITDVTIESTTREGVSVGKEGKAKLENVTITKAGNFGVASYGGEVDVRNSKIADSGNAGIIAKDGSALTVKVVSIKNAGKQAIAIEGDSVSGIADCKIDTTKNAAVYISKSTVTMKDSTIDNAGTYAIAVKDSKKADGKKVHLDDIVINNPKAQGIGNINSYVLPQNIKIYGSGQAGIYTEGKDSITNMNQIEVVNSNTSGLGFKGGEITARNVTITSSKKQGIIALKDANIKQLDNVLITDAGSHGMEIDGAKCKITVDEEYNPENTNGNGVTIINPNNVGILCKNGGIVNAKNVTVKNAKSQAFSVEKESKCTVDGCTIEKTGKAGIYVFDSTFTMKNASLTDAATVGIAVKDCSKADGKKVQLDTVTIKNTGAQGISNNNSYVLPQNIKIYNTKQASIYSEGTDAITNMNQIEIVDSGTSGFGFKAGEVTARNVIITNPKNHGIDLLADANIKKLDNVVITKPGVNGINNQGGIVTITVDKTYNPENTNDNGVTIVSPGSYGINISKGGTVKAVGTTITDAGDRGISSAGALVVAGAGEKKNGVTISGTNGHGIYLTADASIKGNNLYIADTGKIGIFSEGATLDVSAFKLENTKEQGVQFKGGKAILSDFNVGKTASAAIKVIGGADVTLKNGTIAANSYAIATESGEGAVSKATAIDVKIERVNKEFKGELVSVGANSEFSLSGEKSVVDGKYTKETPDFAGRGVRVYGTFTMNDGSILRNNGDNGAGVRVEKDATFTMNGGSIKENMISKSSTGYGAGVFVEGTFTMNEGVISNHGDEDTPIKVEGTAVCLNKDSAVFTMNGGKISGNYSTAAGAGVAMINGNAQYPKFTMNGGTITDNHTTGNVGGIVVRTGTFTMNEGATISNNTADKLAGGMSLEGTSTTKFVLNGGAFSGNSAGTRGDDIYLSGRITLAKALTEENTISISPSGYSNARVIAVADEALSEDAFAASMKYIDVESDEWFVAEDGTLALTSGPVMVGNRYYASLEEAVKAANKTSAEDTITVLNSVTVAESMQIKEDVKIVSEEAVSITATDAVSGHMFDVTNGTLTITGKSENAKISLGAGKTTQAIVHTNGGNTVLTNVELNGNTNSSATSNTGRGIFSEAGTVTANSVIIQNMTKGDGIYIKAGTTLNLDNVKITDVARYGIKTYGTVNIYNTKNSVHALTIQNTKDHGIDVDNAGQVKSELTNISENTYAITIQDTVSEGIKSSKMGVIIRNGASIDISNLYVLNVKAQGIYFAGTGTRELSNFKVENSGSEAIYVAKDASVVTIEKGIIDNVIKLGRALTGNDVISIIPSSYTVGKVIAVKDTTNTAFSENDFKGSMQYIKIEPDNTTDYYVSESGKLSLAIGPVKLGDVVYSSLESAVEAAVAGDTITILRDVTLSEQIKKAVTLKANEAVSITAVDALSGGMFNVTSGTLTITGKSEDAKINLVSGKKTTNIIYTNGGNVELENVKLAGNTESTVNANAAYGIYNNAGTVTAKNVVVKDITKGDGIYVKAGATVNVDNVSISNTGRYGIKTYGTVNIYNTKNSAHALTIQNTYDHGIDIQKTENAVAGKVVSYLTNVPENTYAIKIDTTSKSSSIGILVRDNCSVDLTHVSVKNTKQQGILFNGTATDKTASGNIANFEVTGTGAAAVELKFSTVTLFNDKESNVKLDGNSVIRLATALTKDINVTLASYTEGATIVVKDDAMLESDFQASMKHIKIAPNDNVEWHVDAAGKLTKTGAILSNGSVSTHYTTLQNAIDAASDGDSIKICENATITKKVQKALTLTSSKAVTVTADSNINSALIAVDSGKALTIIGATTEKRISLVGISGQNVIGSTGTLILENVNITGGNRGIYANGGMVNLKAVTISGFSGEGFRIDAGGVEVNASDIKVLKTTGSGNAVYFKGTTNSKVTGKISDFTIEGVGSAAFKLNNSRIELENGTITSSTWCVATESDSTLTAKDVNVKTTGNANNVLSINSTNVTSSGYTGITILANE